MTIIIEGKALEKSPSRLAELWQRYPHFKELAEKFCAKKKMKVKEEQLLYVGQREMAATDSSDGVIKILGTEDATTCHMVVLRHTGSTASCLCHFDGCSTKQAAQCMIKKVETCSRGHTHGRLELTLVGGFTDDRGSSEKLSISILDVFCKSDSAIHLVEACITDLNTVYSIGLPWPDIYGIGVDVQSGEVFPAMFPEKGPDMTLRSARLFTGGQEVLDIYNSETGQLVIGPFHYDKMHDVSGWCAAPDHMLRKYLSSSPEQEPDDFVSGVRMALIQIRDYPDPLNSVFNGGKPRVYSKLPDGTWTSLKNT